MTLIGKILGTDKPVLDVTCSEPTTVPEATPEEPKRSPGRPATFPGEATRNTAVTMRESTYASLKRLADARKETLAAIVDAAILRYAEDCAADAAAQAEAAAIVGE